MDICFSNVDMDLLAKQYEELQICVINEPDNVLWGLVEMIGDILDGKA
jgi:hypothetical protein